MAVAPPFIYDKPSSYTFDGPQSRGFNPKAVTYASWTPKQTKVKQDGPLISFNRHPDSYHQSPYGNVSYIPVSPHTKGRVTAAWKSQRVLRAFALLGALGAVFCIIVLRKTSTGVGWIIRVGPALALAHTLYATYFHFRGINSRSPASCASYQMFAALIDAGLLPFFAISCYMATLDFTSNVYGWDTLFNDNDQDYKIIQTFMILCGIEGFLLLLSLFVDIYLAVIYRKIIHLPPDMNPLEEKDNLTSRLRHKRNKSDLLFDKHMSNSTMASERFSQMIRPDINSRRVPFKHTRTDSVDRDSFSFKKDFVAEFKDPYSVRASLQSERDNASLPRPSSAHTPATNARPAGAGLDNKSARSSRLGVPAPRPSSWLSSTHYEGMPAEVNDYENFYQTMSPASPTNDHHDYNAHRLTTQTPAVELTSLALPPYPGQEREDDMPSPENLSLALPPSFPSQKKRSREPLGMNPPTPVNDHFADATLVVKPLSLPAQGTPPRQALQEADVNSIAHYATPASRPASFVGSGTKGRFYGDLRTSMGGSPTRGGYNHEEEEEDDVTRSNTVKSTESGNFEVYASESDEEYDPYRAQYGVVQHGPAVVVGNSSPGREWNGQRQVSNSTGYDLHSGYAGLDPEFGRGMATRRREVSGKIAEEGRGFEISTQPVAVQSNKPGAAGWARFKGL
ncbi:hypothetical protein LTS08_004332 [Lithohypha guttulata]|nr:hypothetical protein LTS08_004332 [Lithohypha guttulata]